MELVDLVDENRVPLGKTGDRYTHSVPGELRSVIHVCIFNQAGKLLIQQRSADKKDWPGCWDVSAAGGVAAGETSRLSAEREVREELGLDLDLSGIRPTCTVNFDRGFDDFFIVNREIDLDQLTLQTEEVSDACWASFEEVKTMMRRGKFVAYPLSFLEFLWDMRNTFGFIKKNP